VVYGVRKSWRVHNVFEPESEEEELDRLQTQNIAHPNAGRLDGVAERVADTTSTTTSGPGPGPSRVFAWRRIRSSWSVVALGTAPSPRVAAFPTCR